MPRIADYLTLWDEGFELDGGGRKGPIQFAVPSDTNLSSPTVLLFNFGAYSHDDAAIELDLIISINGVDVYSWSVKGASIQILKSSHHRVISRQILKQGDGANRIEVRCGAELHCYMKFSDVVLMFQRNI